MLSEAFGEKKPFFKKDYKLSIMNQFPFGNNIMLFLFTLRQFAFWRLLKRFELNIYVEQFS